jgi:hypothetical protein
MKWSTGKKASDINLKGIKVDSDKTDKHITTIILTDEAGNQVKFTGGNCYSDIPFQVPAKPETVKKFVVTGKIEGVEILPKQFDERYEAEQFIQINRGELIIEEKEIQIED